MKKLIVAVLMLSAAPAFAEEAAMIVGPFEGQAAIENGNKKLAREQALESAIRNALVAGAGAQVDSATITEGGVLLQDKIFVHANGYVKKYELERDTEEDGVWSIKINHVYYGASDLSRDLQAVKAEIANRGHPRVYVLLREQSIESLNEQNPTQKGKPEAAVIAQLSQGTVEQRLMSHLTPLGWKFVDPEVASGKVHVQNALTTDLASLNGRDFALTGADYVILGSIIVRPIDTATMSKNSAATVELRAVANIKATDTGDTVASVQMSQQVTNVVGPNEAAGKALALAGDKLAEDLQKQVLETWRRNRMGVGNLHVLASVADYDVLQALEEQIQKGVANVKSVDEVSFNDGKADLSVMLAGTNPKQLANSLNNKSVKGATVKVTKVTTNTVEVKLVK